MPWATNVFGIHTIMYYSRPLTVIPFGASGLVVHDGGVSLFMSGVDALEVYSYVLHLLDNVCVSLLFSVLSPMVPVLNSTLGKSIFLDCSKPERATLRA